MESQKWKSVKNNFIRQKEQEFKDGGFSRNNENESSINPIYHEIDAL